MGGPGDASRTESPGNVSHDQIEWDEIDRPGCYLHVRSGDLFRIPAAGLTNANLPVISMTSRDPILMIRISDNPAESIPILRRMAGMIGYLVNF